MLLYDKLFLRYLEKHGEEFILKRYVYKPYHSWRHGYRKEKIHAWMIGFLRILLLAECLILSQRYLEEHTAIQMHEREVPYEIEAERVYGIGFEPEDGKVFWFQKNSQMKQE